ncbi:hypothetical protein [Lacticaseibacillus kribbianus]|uniref:hypothetical protein n=1 Tax=Lacticaseibacillus kribbianus TaxID=2926292 RepID=UPI001CD74670|nr:hypothetical protein [Lacticaseibacillus kribbianus]
MQKIVYVPVERRLFDAAAADAIFDQMRGQLQSLPNVMLPAHNLGTPSEMIEYLRGIPSSEVGGVIFHNTSFTGSEFIELIHQYFPSVPVLVIASREPSIGGWLRLNGATGLISTANYLKRRHHTYDFIYGDPTEPAVQKKVAAYVRAVNTMLAIRTLTIGVVGSFPVGFDFAGADEGELATVFGTHLKHYDVDASFAAADALTPTDFADELAYAKAHIRGLDVNLPETIKFVKFVALIRQRAGADGLGALASRCWPDFFDSYHAAPGAVWSQLCDEGIPTAMECDIHGALSMAILQQFAGAKTPVYMGDISSLDSSDNTLTVWHDYGPYAMANPKYGVVASVHPNRKMPVSPQAVLKPGRVTLLRVHVNAEGAYELVVLTGEALDVPAQFNGFSGRFHMTAPVAETFNDIVRHGFEQHYALIYGDYVDDLATLATVMGLPVTMYK